MPSLSTAASPISCTRHAHHCCWRQSTVHVRVLAAVLRACQACTHVVLLEGCSQRPSDSDARLFLFDRRCLHWQGWVHYVSSDKGVNLGAYIHMHFEKLNFDVPRIKLRLVLT